MHWFAAEHRFPFGRLNSQVVPLQNALGAQPVSAEQVCLHAVAVQMPGAQLVVVRAGQALLAPVHDAGLTRTVALWQLATRQEKPAGRGSSSGHDKPLQVSATSQRSVTGWQTVPAGGLAAQMSPGHVDMLGGHVVPLQISGGSQDGSLGGRHTVPAATAGWVQAAETPSHTSCVQTFASMPPGQGPVRMVFVGQVVEPPQVSAGSQSPPATRHCVAAGEAVVMQLWLALQVSTVHGFESWPVHAAPFGKKGPHVPLPAWQLGAPLKQRPTQLPTLQHTLLTQNPAAVDPPGSAHCAATEQALPRGRR